MAQRTYEGDPIDATMDHLAERDLDEEAENVEVPSEETHEGKISTEYGFLNDETLSKKEKVERLWRGTRLSTVKPHLNTEETHLSTTEQEFVEAYCESDAPAESELIEENIERNLYKLGGIARTDILVEAIQERVGTE